MSDTEGLVAVVTGAGSGIGRGIALAMAEAGYHVVIADISGQAGEETARLIREKDGKAFSVVADITSAQSVQALLDTTVEKAGTPWVLINNAGWSGVMGTFLENDPEVWARLINLNYLGTLTITQPFVRAMVEAGKGGRIVNIGSDSARGGSPGEAVYSGTKGAIVAFTKSLGRELVGDGITVNCISPGPVDTPMLNRAPQEMRDYWAAAMPMKRFARPDEIAVAACFFASPAASYVTGQILSVSGAAVMAG